MAACALIAGCFDLSAGASSALTPGPARLIYAGWFYKAAPVNSPLPTPAWLGANLDFMETQPFDGMIVYLTDSDVDPTPINVSATILGTTAISYDAIMEVLEPLVGLSAETLTDNFGLIIGGSPPDFFDSWAVTIQNMRNLARAAKDAGLKGLAFDPEQYSSQWPNYGSDGVLYEDTYSLAAYQAQARTRGQQLMEAMIEEFPDIVVLWLHGPYISEPDAPAALGFNPSWVDANELIGPFFAGHLAGVGSSSARCIDGGGLYHHRSESDFETSAAWRRNDLASAAVDCSFIPAALREVWPTRTSIGFGVYDTAFVGQAMNPTILRTTLNNALQAADHYVWLYTESQTFLLSAEDGGAGEEWVQAIELAREDAAIPAAPSALTPANSTWTAITLSWTDGSSNEDGFIIKRLTSGGTWSDVGTVGANTTTFTEQNLPSGTWLTYHVRAHNGSGESGPTNVLHVQTRAAGSPATPSSLVVTGVTPSSVSLSWTDNSASENGFSIEMMSGGSWSQAATEPDNAATCTVPNLSANTSYSFRVCAFNGSGNSWVSNVVTATTSP